MLSKVLVVDDSALIHQMYRLLFSRYGCEFFDAMNGVEALEVLAGHPDLELVVLDINMPLMNGVQFLEKASASGLADRIPIIVVSTEGKEEDTLRCLKLGARAYLTKPFEPSDFHAIITKLFPTAHRAGGIIS